MCVITPNTINVHVRPLSLPPIIMFLLKYWKVFWQFKATIVRASPLAAAAAAAAAVEVVVVQALVEAVTALVAMAPMTVAVVARAVVVAVLAILLVLAMAILALVDIQIGIENCFIFFFHTHPSQLHLFSFVLDLIFFTI